MDRDLAVALKDIDRLSDEVESLSLQIATQDIHGVSRASQADRDVLQLVGMLHRALVLVDDMKRMEME